jgi:hypothetical protein
VGSILGTGASLAALAVGKGASLARNKIVDALEQERNLRLAKYILPTQGPERDELIKSLETVANKNSTRLTARQKLSLARLVGP